VLIGTCPFSVDQAIILLMLLPALSCATLRTGAVKYGGVVASCSSPGASFPWDTGGESEDMWLPKMRSSFSVDMLIVSQDAEKDERQI
jgi:hypothetical protein